MRIKDGGGKEASLGLFKPADDTQEARAAAAELGARAAARHLHASGRGELASFDADGVHPQTPRFIGVNEEKRDGVATGSWIATIEEGGRTARIGVYDSAEEAARAYDARARPLGRVTNFRK